MLVAQICPKQTKDGGRTGAISNGLPILPEFGTIMHVGPLNTTANKILKIQESRQQHFENQKNMISQKPHKHTQTHL